jgi:hypothetical protein
MTHSTEHLTANAFAEALQAARPGEVITYAIGDLLCSVIHAAAELDLVRKMARDAYERGEACLVQRRRPDLPFAGGPRASSEYLAIKRLWA